MCWNTLWTGWDCGGNRFYSGISYRSQKNPGSGCCLSAFPAEGGTPNCEWWRKGGIDKKIKHGEKQEWISLILLSKHKKHTLILYNTNIPFLEDVCGANDFISCLCCEGLFQKLVGPFEHRHGNQDTRFILYRAKQRTLISPYISGPVAMGQENLLQSSMQKNC